MNRKKLVQHCIQGLISFEDRFDAVAPEDAAWVRERLAWHKLLPLAAALDDPEKPKCPELASCFHDTVIQNAIREKRYEKQVRDVFQILGNASIEFMPYKGPFWVRRLYPEYSWRHIGDIDLLMDIDAARKASAILQDLGYVPDIVEGSEDEDFKRRGELTLFNDPLKKNEVPVQLHWDPLPSPRFLKKNFMPAECFQDGATEDSWKGIGFLVPRPEVRFLYYVFHAVCQHQFLRFAHILTPIHFLDKFPDPDWQLVHDLAEQRQALTPLCYGLRFIHAYSPLPQRGQRLMDRLKPAIKTRLAATVLQPAAILHATRKHGGYRRKIFRAAMSW